MNTSITKSLLTSLCQRDGIKPSLAKRGNAYGSPIGSEPQLIEEPTAHRGRFFNNNALLKYSLVTLVILVSFILPAASHASILLDRVVAVVNKEVITWSELYKAMEFEVATQVKNLSDEERKKLFTENEGSFLETLINMRLQLQEANTLGIDVSQHEITETIDTIQKKYSMTQADFTESLKKEGLSLEEYKKRLSEQILINKVVTYQIRNKIIVSDAEVNRYMEANNEAPTGSETYKLKQIFFKKPERDTDKKTVEEKAAEITRRLKNGEDFSSLARLYSEDSSARSDGDLGFVKKDLLAKEFVDVLAGMNAGDYSMPFWTDRGLHIIRLDEKVSAQTPDKVKEVVRKQLAEEHFSEKYRDWIKGLREKAYIEIRL